jgi:hypothetical protein
MFANAQMMGVDLAFPDVCKTPPAAFPLDRSPAACSPTHVVGDGPLAPRG